MKDISKEEWKELIQNDDSAVVMDVRTPAECSEGMQKNAIQLDLMNASAFMEGVEKLDKSKTYYVYCRSGGRSGQACQIMDSKGVKSFNLIGGMMFWDGEIV
ncbi:MAG: rhodanese-related sulfurtransferase [Parvicella sp.]|jgi:rhodanese-related sulfurtransferase